MRIRSLIIALTASLIAPVAFGQSADIMTVVDESGSMGGEHIWLPDMITALEAGLNTAGIGTAPDENNYSATGFGATGSHTGAGSGPHTHEVVAGDPWFDASDYAAIAGQFVTSGGFEDGYGAMIAALGLTPNAGAARNVILVTDEDRDVGSVISSADMLAALLNGNALLNVVVNANFFCGDNTTRALGIDSAGNGYVADGSGGFTTCAGGHAQGSAFGTTIADYVNVALATGGAAWDLNLLRAGGNTGVSFTAAFVAIKVKEIEEQNTVPEPGTLALFGIGLIGLGISRRRRIK